jgi:hypothetical protein
VGTGVGEGDCRRDRLRLAKGLAAERMCRVMKQMGARDTSRGTYSSHQAAPHCPRPWQLVLAPYQGPRSASAVYKSIGE